MQYRRLLKKSIDLKVRPISETQYKVSSSSIAGKEYEVDIKNELCDCPEGIGGKFCKHLCSVPAKAEIHLRNLPSLNDQDKQDILYLATGNVENINFYRGLDEIQMNGGHSALVMEESSDRPATEQQSSDQSFPATEVPEEEIRQEFSEVKSIIAELEEECLRNPDRELLSNIRRFKKKLGTVKTKAQFNTFCREKGRKCGRMIPVQPTSQSRRVKRAGLSSGAKRVQAGRPSKFENIIRKTKKKRPHNLAKNVSKNLPNAKSHTTGM
ncbi:unnamed protein product [Bemisia tabaci]|uniref:SWIM-type domain-containing protein n=2 Tax=Bemisia tabaci TaxID=7038 RepID=A0A9P0AIP6_BEMTA|nr:unnamed protein product [Bemisia tabaci]